MKKEWIISSKYIYEFSDVTPKLNCSRKQQRKTCYFPFILNVEALCVITNIAKEQSGWASQLWAREGVAAGGRQHLNNRSSIGKGANWQRNETNERRLSFYLQNMLQNTIFTIKRQQSLLRSNPKQSLKVITPIMIYNIQWCQLLLNSIVIHNRCVDTVDRHFEHTRKNCLQILWKSAKLHVYPIFKFQEMASFITSSLRTCMENI